MLLSRTGKLRPDRTSKEPCRDELTSSFGLHSQLEQAAVHARMNASKSVRISIISPSPSARPKRRASTGRRSVRNNNRGGALKIYIATDFNPERVAHASYLH